MDKIRCMLKIRIKLLSHRIKTINPSIFLKFRSEKTTRSITRSVCTVPADKEVNNCKDYYINCILEDPRFNSASGNSHIDKLESKLTF